MAQSNQISLSFIGSFNLIEPCQYHQLSYLHPSIHRSYIFTTVSDLRFSLIFWRFSDPFFLLSSSIWIRFSLILWKILQPFSLLLFKRKSEFELWTKEPNFLKKYIVSWSHQHRTQESFNTPLACVNLIHSWKINWWYMINQYQWGRTQCARVCVWVYI